MTNPKLTQPPPDGQLPAMTPHQAKSQLQADLDALPHRAVAGEYSMKELDVLAQVLVNSKLMGEMKNKSQAIMLMMKCVSTGLNPGEVYEYYDYMEIPSREKNERGQWVAGPPRISFRKKSLAIWAQYRMMGGKIKLIEHTEDKIIGVASFPGDDDVDLSYSIKALSEAGVITTFGKGGVKKIKHQWTSQPKVMLFYTAVRAAARIHTPYLIIDVKTPSIPGMEMPTPAMPVPNMPQVEAKPVAAALPNNPKPTTMPVVPGDPAPSLTDVVAQDGGGDDVEHAGEPSDESAVGSTPVGSTPPGELFSIPPNNSGLE